MSLQRNMTEKLITTQGGSRHSLKISKGKQQERNVSHIRTLLGSAHLGWNSTFNSFAHKSKITPRPSEMCLCLSILSSYSIHTYFLPCASEFVWQNKKGIGKASGQTLLISFMFLSTGEKQLKPSWSQGGQLKAHLGFTGCLASWQSCRVRVSSAGAMHVPWRLNHDHGQTSHIQECKGASNWWGSSQHVLLGEVPSLPPCWFYPLFFIIHSGCVRSPSGRAVLKRWLPLETANSSTTERCYSQLEAIYMWWYLRKTVLL